MQCLQKNFRSSSLKLRKQTHEEVNLVEFGIFGVSFENEKDYRKLEMMHKVENKDTKSFLEYS